MDSRMSPMARCASFFFGHLENHFGYHRCDKSTVTYLASATTTVAELTLQISLIVETSIFR